MAERTKKNEQGAKVVDLNTLVRNLGFSASDLDAIQEVQKVLGDPRVRVEVMPTTDCHSNMMAILDGKQSVTHPGSF